MCATEQPASEAGECGESADSREPDGSAKRAERIGLQKREGHAPGATPGPRVVHYEVLARSDVPCERASPSS
jgi:hypothetical protein